MCTARVALIAREPLANLLRDMAEALDPGHGDSVIVGPVDFGRVDEYPEANECPYCAAQMADDDGSSWPYCMCEDFQRSGEEDADRLYSIFRDSY